MKTLLLASLWAPAVLAFGPTGHVVVGDLAERRLCDEAKRAVDDILAGQRLADAGRWPDWIRRRPEWQHSAPWHFINVPDAGHLRDVVGRPGGDVIEATDRYLDRVADARLSREERAEALRFAAHFLADLHQPLHVGRLDDRGGNRIDVWVGAERTNLHALWDAEDLLDSYGLGRVALANLLAGQVGARYARWSSGTPLDWAVESQRLRPVVYAPVRGAKLRIGRGSRYWHTARDIVSERLAQAGVRLAYTLNSIFCNTS